jgi:hypothetical protein
VKAIPYLLIKPFVINKYYILFALYFQVHLVLFTCTENMGIKEQQITLFHMHACKKLKASHLQNFP